MARKPGRPRKTTKTAQTAQATAQAVAGRKPTAPRVKPPEPRTYENIAKRVLSAVEEFNAAFKEAHEFSDMTIKVRITDTGPPLHVTRCRIFRLTDFAPETLEWRVVHDLDTEKIKMEMRQTKAPE